MPILTFLINIGGVNLLLLIFSLALLIPVWWGGGGSEAQHGQQKSE